MNARLGEDARRELTFTFDGRAVRAREGDTIAMALWAAGQRALRNSSRDGAPRGVLCNMGVCYECLVVLVESSVEGGVESGATVRACTTLVVDGMRVLTGGRP